MQDTRYLYGNLDKAIIQVQHTVAKAKIKACNDLIDDLYKMPREARDEERINDIVKARDFNEQLLEEK